MSPIESKFAAFIKEKLGQSVVDTIELAGTKGIRLTEKQHQVLDMIVEDKMDIFKSFYILGFIHSNMTGGDIEGADVIRLLERLFK